MNRESITKLSADFLKKPENNSVLAEIAISEEVSGLIIFDDPVLAFGNADDELFDGLKQPGIIGNHFVTPLEWMPSAKTVISFFFPFSEKVRKTNGELKTEPSFEWLHARIEGQQFIFKFLNYMKDELIRLGYNSIIPSADSRFFDITEIGETKELSFTSNWSERHVAYVCGQGTFGLSKGLITKRGMAGRFGSIVTELYIPAIERKYEDVYDYCVMCGKCAKNCPAGAITVKDGKDHIKCNEFVKLTKAKYSPRYGCGKCQVNVPCEIKIPNEEKWRI